MEIRKARKVVKEMEACFAELGLRIVNETEEVNQGVITDHLICRSYSSKGEILAEVLGILVPNHEVIQLSMNFYHDLTRLTRPEFLQVLNILNFVAFDSYWVRFENQEKTEFRTAFAIPEGRVNRKHFLRVLKRFLESGLEQYCRIWRFIEGSENVSKFLKRVKLKMQAQ
jgi:hypothetical protein